jgi:multiple sugar transport system substrate-binding protein
MSAISVFLLLFLLVTGCGRQHARLSFAVGGTPSELTVWEKIGKKFEDESGIPVEILRMPANSGQQRQALLVAMEAGQPDPDVFLMDVAWVGTFVAARWLSPLSGLDRDAFFPRILETVDLHNGRLLAAPVYLDVGLLYYRTDLLKLGGLTEPPRTWAQLVDSARKVQEIERKKDTEFYGFVWQGAQYEGLVVNFMEFAGSKGGFSVHDSDVNIDLPDNVPALALMRNCIWKYAISPPSTYTEMREEQVRRYFQAGHALYERNWPYAWALHQSPGSPVRGKVGVASLPGPKAGKAAPALGGYHVGVSVFSDKMEAAKRFAGFITSREVQKTLTLQLGWNPGRSDLYENPEVLAKNPYFAELKGEFRTARPRPIVPYYTQVSELTRRYLSAVLSREKSPREAINEAQEALVRLERRYGYRHSPERRARR